MRNLLLLIVLLLLQGTLVFSQGKFHLQDTSFQVGQVLTPNIVYDLSICTVHPKSIETMDSIVDFLYRNPKISVEFGVHTNTIADSSMNHDISTCRAKRLSLYCIERGIDSARVTFMGYGRSRPVIVNDEIQREHPFLTIGQELNVDYLEHMSSQDRMKIAYLLNYTEIRITRIN
jgi:outer membrane protein OmpA-like peptidoglycan-associated protein